MKGSYGKALRRQNRTQLGLRLLTLPVAHEHKGAIVGLVETPGACELCLEGAATEAEGRQLNQAEIVAAIVAADYDGLNMGPDEDCTKRLCRDCAEFMLPWQFVELTRCSAAVCPGWPAIEGGHPCADQLDTGRWRAEAPYPTAPAAEASCVNCGCGPHPGDRCQTIFESSVSGTLAGPDTRRCVCDEYVAAVPEADGGDDGSDV